MQSHKILNIVNQVVADGEALMNLALITKGQSSYNTIMSAGSINHQELQK